MTIGERRRYDHAIPSEATSIRLVFHFDPWRRENIELWESARLLRSLRREASWFPEIDLYELGSGVEDPPGPFTTIASIAADDSLLWVAIVLADERWDGGTQYQDRSLVYDTMVEVIDWRSNRVVGRERFDEIFELVQPGLLGRLAVTPEGTVRYRTARALLAGR